MLGAVPLGCRTRGEDRIMSEYPNWYEVCRLVREHVASDIEAGHLDLSDDDRLHEYPHEYADGSEWVIYTHHVMRLWCDSSEVSDREEEIADYVAPDDGIVRRMTLCVYLAIRDEVESAIREIVAESELA
jgi:hypothetical protein